MNPESTDLVYLKFELRSLDGAVPLALAREVLPMAELLTPPHLAPTVAGLLNLGGRNYPVLRLDRLLGIEGFEPGVESHLIFVRSERLPCLLLVDRVLGVDRVAAADLQAVPSYVTSGVGVAGQYRSGERTINVLNLERLLEAPARSLRVVA